MGKRVRCKSALFLQLLEVIVKSVNDGQVNFFKSLENLDQAGFERLIAIVKGSHAREYELLDGMVEVVDLTKDKVEALELERAVMVFTDLMGSKDAISIEIRFRDCRDQGDLGFNLEKGFVRLHPEENEGLFHGFSKKRVCEIIHEDGHTEAKLIFHY